MRILVVGCGSVGRRHAENASAMAEVGVYDTCVDAATHCARALKGQYFLTLADSLAWKPDGVVVATPNNTHLDIAGKAIKAGADVLIEKPISHSMVGLEAFLSQVEKLGRKVFVVCNLRFHPAVAGLQHFLDTIGRPLCARAYYGSYLPDMRPGTDYRKLYCAQRAQGGGVILDSIHEIDYLTWFFGGVESVLCRATKLSDLEIDVEDYASICLQHVSGVSSEIHLDFVQRVKRRGCELIGTHGTLVWQSEGRQPERCEVRLYTNRSRKWEIVYSTEDLDTAQPYISLMSQFADSLSGGAPAIQTAREGARALQIALAAKAGAESGRTVRLESSV